MSLQLRFCGGGDPRSILVVRGWPPAALRRISPKSSLSYDPRPDPRTVGQTTDRGLGPWIEAQNLVSEVDRQTDRTDRGSVHRPSISRQVETPMAPKNPSSKVDQQIDSIESGSVHGPSINL
ncbi:hypothetical protein MTR67_031150 [Solanum verrucosum]|uniref:Late blight resistance protein n=1 Tax=Solanum verrucosum TaxID=315347 RepID=A0AAF0U1W4_SOLVR|nr:hypothetical protein MTR67_031150 [Solanum verrucosum]